MARKTQQRTLETRERILSVTRQLFDELGEKNVTTDLIARSAQVAKGTIFAHFADRSNLVAAIGAADLDLIISRIRIEVQARPVSNLIGQLMQVYAPLLQFFAQKPEFATLYVYYATQAENEWSRRFTKTCLSFEEILGDVLRKASPGVANGPGRDTDFLVNGMQAFFLQSVIYRMSGWIEGDLQAEQQLRRYLERWLEPAN